MVLSHHKYYFDEYQNSFHKLLTNIASHENKKCIYVDYNNREEQAKYFMFIDSYDEIKVMFRVESIYRDDDGLVSYECVYVTRGFQEYNKPNMKYHNNVSKCYDGAYYMKYMPYFCKKGENVEKENSEIMVMFYDEN